MPAPEHRDALLALADLRAEAGGVLLPLLRQPRYPHADLALEVLAWSRDAAVGPALMQLVFDRVPLPRRTQARRRALPPRRPSVGEDVPYRGVLRALRGHASDRVEPFLLLAARDWDPTYRAAAVGSLGWWEATPTRRSARRPARPWPAWASARRCNGSARR